MYSRYDRYKPVGNEPVKQVNVRVPERFKTALDTIDFMEGGDGNGGRLAVEGIGRVLEDRAEEMLELTKDLKADRVQEARQVFQEIIDNK